MPGETLTIETPEHVELQFALASIGNRFLACAIDHFLQLAAVAVVAVVTWLIGGWMRWSGGGINRVIAEGGLWFYALATLAVFVLFFGYFVLFETLWNGQTPGKRWLRLRVIQEDGRPLTFFAALSRNMIRGADMMPALVILPFYSIGIIAVFGSRRSQRIGDMVAGTVVIKERSAEAPTFDEIFDSEVIDSSRRRIAPAIKFEGDVKQLTAEELAVVEAFLRRREEIPEHPRKWLAWRIGSPLILKVNGRFEPHSFSQEGFLEELVSRHANLNRSRVEKRYARLPQDGKTQK